MPFHDAHGLTARPDSSGDNGSKHGTNRYNKTSSDSAKKLNRYRTAKGITHAIAFSSKVDTGSREENVSEQ